MRRALPERVPEEDSAPSIQPTSGMAGNLLHLQATGGNQMVGRLLASQIRTGQGGGEPLPEPVRADLEQGLGSPLGDVRVHRDTHAAALADQLGARAFTTGQDIFFGAGAY